MTGTGVKIMTACLIQMPPIVFEDEWLIAFDKPSGLLTEPDRWNKSRGCLTDLIHRHISPAIFNAHRLDAETSGVLLCSKTKPILTALCRQFGTGQVKKRHLALIDGSLPKPELEIRREMERDPNQPGRMRVAPAYRRGACRTHVRTIDLFRAHSLLEACPCTDKTHQIRVHLAHIGCPIIADSFYGNGQGLYLSAIKPGYKFKPREPERPLIGRVALHAESLTFSHPVTNNELTIAAPWPKDFAIAIKYLKRFASSGGNMV